MNIGIVGAGMMGAEIALCFALKKHEVAMKETSLELAQKGKVRLEGVMDKLIRRGSIEAAAKYPTLELLRPTEDYSDLTQADLVVEAVFENEAVKMEVFKDLDKVCRPECVWATNTSSISVTRLGAGMSEARRSRFLGAHFFSPASVMKLVEVIPGLETGSETVEFMKETCLKIDKSPITVKDVTGFAVNRILHAMWIEANRLLEEGVASVEDIDTACKLGLGHPIGPYALMDLTSNDLNLSVQEILFQEYGERFRPRPILKQKVNANHLGRKTARGWFDYRQ